MDEKFEGLPGITPLVDDIIVTRRTLEEHDTNLSAMLERAADKNLKLNPDKLTVGVQEVEYFGHIISADGLKPDPTKVKAIQDMLPPVNKKELQTMLRMINYLVKFAPQLSEMMKPIRDLLKEDSEFLWDQPQRDTLDRTKAIILSQPVLLFFFRYEKANHSTSGCKQTWPGSSSVPRGQAHHFHIQEPQYNQTELHPD